MKKKGKKPMPVTLDKPASYLAKSFVTFSGKQALAPKKKKKKR